MIWTIVGSAAATLTMFAFIPQIIKIAKTKSASDVSFFTILQMCLGVTLWLLYGLHIKDAIIIIANGITAVSLIFLLILYFRYR